MRLDKKAFIVLFLLINAALLAADEFLVTYAEGKVEQKLGPAWKAVAVGDLLPDTGVVRVGADALLEMRIKNDTVAVYQSGTYTLKNFIPLARERKSGRLFASVNAKIKNVAGRPDERRKSSAAGVKGDKLPAADRDLSWSGEENDPVPDGQKLIAAENYRAAADYFQAALRADHDQGLDPEFYYYLAFACDRNGETARALKYADKIALEPDDPRFADYALLKGSLLVKGFSYKKALDVFSRYLAAFPAGGEAQDVLLLAAYCYRNTGDVKRERESLQKAVQIDPASDAGKEAAVQLKGRN